MAETKTPLLAFGESSHLGDRLHAVHRDRRVAARVDRTDRLPDADDRAARADSADDRVRHDPRGQLAQHLRAEPAAVLLDVPFAVEQLRGEVAAATIDIALPVFPVEASTIVSPGCSRPSASAFSVRYFAIRALIDPDGLRNSNFTHTSIDPDQRCVTDAVRDRRVPRSARRAVGR